MMRRKTCPENLPAKESALPASGMTCARVHKNGEGSMTTTNPKAFLIDLDGTLCLKK